MADIRTLLLALQHADSFFPSGGLAFSWGLERLASDGFVRSSSDVRQFLADQLRLRWATFDRVALVETVRSAGDLDRTVLVDEAVHACSLPALLRDGSIRAGAALLSVHGRLEMKQASEYLQRVHSQRARGHLPVAQGLVWSNLGFDEEGASAIAGYGLSIAILSAALRLGLIGHLDAQRILNDARSIVLDTISTPAPPLEEISAYSPLADIAAMRHETAAPRLFAN